MVPITPVVPTTPVVATSVATPEDNSSLIIIASASVLGSLLFLVMLLLLTLICVVLCKKKPSRRYHISGSHERNAYETNRLNVPNNEIDGINKKCLEDSVVPQPPCDPDYATIQEYRQMTGMLPKQPSSVNNAFYASTASMACRSNISEPPEYTQVIEAGPPVESPLGNTRGLGQSCAAYSLQDMRGCLVKERHAYNLAGSHSQRAMTLKSFNSHSTHNIPLQTLRRSETMKQAGPPPPPRSLGVQRQASQRSIPGEPYILQPGSLRSPLTQCVRAATSPEVHSNAGDEEADVGPDNYITLP